MTTGCAGPRLDAFEATLARHDSATAALEDWCGVRRLATAQGITATTVETVELRAGTPDEAPRGALGVGPTEPVGYRHVRLDCGGVVLSEAYNWFVPGLLTAEMNRTLATTRVPFGRSTVRVLALP